MVGRLCIPRQEGEMMLRRSLVPRLLLALLLSVTLASCATAAGPALTPPSPTASPAPTAAPRTPLPPPPISVVVEHRTNGTSVVRDVGNAYEFTVSQEWMVMPVSQEHIDRATQASPALDAEFLRLAQKLKDSQTDAFRLIGINTDSKFAKPENPTLLLVTAIPDRISATMAMPELAHMIQDTV